MGLHTQKSICRNHFLNPQGWFSQEHIKHKRTQKHKKNEQEFLTFLSGKLMESLAEGKIFPLSVSLNEEAKLDPRVMENTNIVACTT